MESETKKLKEGHKEEIKRMKKEKEIIGQENMKSIEKLLIQNNEKLDLSKQINSLKIENASMTQNHHQKLKNLTKT